MGKTRREVEEQVGPSGFADFIDSPVMDSIRLVTGTAPSTISVGEDLPSNIGGKFSPIDKTIELNRRLNFNPESNFRVEGRGAHGIAAPLVAFHEALHEQFKRVSENPESDPEFADLMETVRQSMLDLPLEVLEKKTKITTNARNKKNPIRAFQDVRGADEMIERLSTEYISYIGEFALHNIRRFGNPTMALHSAGLVEDRYPGAIAITNYILRQLR